MKLDIGFRRRSSDKSKGPGTVIGKENKQILVKHGSYYKREQPYNLQLISSNNPEPNKRNKNRKKQRF